MRYVSPAVVAGGLGLAAALLTACGGGSGLLSSNQASALSTELSRVATDVANGNCTNADNAIGSIQQQVAALPGSIDPTLVQNLARGAGTVRALADRQCRGNVGGGSQTTSVPTTTPTTTHAHTTSTSTSATTTQTQTSTTTAPTTPTTPSTPATSTPTPGTTSTGSDGGAGLPTGPTGNTGQGNGQGN